MNREHILAILWLRWRLTKNQFARGGSLNAIASALMLAFLAIAVIAATIGGFALGWLGAGHGDPVRLLVTWDGIILVFLMFWIGGLLVEIQRSESIDLSRLLHLPITLQQVFLFNFLASLTSPSLLIFTPGMLAVCAGLVLSRGPLLLLLVPLVLGFLTMLAAWTYYLRGWLAALMSNQRRRRAIVVWITLGTILLSQLPNLVVNSRIFRRSPTPQASSDPSTPSPKPNPGPGPDARFRRLHWVIPPGWVGYGAMTLGQGNPWPALASAAAAFLLGGIGLSRAYRMTIRFYTGAVAARKERAPRLAKRNGTSLVEWSIPGLPEDTAALALTTFRSLLRAPELKMALLLPIVAGVMAMSAFVARPKGPVPQQFVPFVTGIAAVFAAFCFGNLMANIFGMDRSGFRALVLLPVSRRNILLARNIAIFPLVATAGVVFQLLLAILLHLSPLTVLTGLVQLLIAFLVISLICNLVAILAPYRFAPGTLQTKKPKAMVFVAAFTTMLSMPLAVIPVMVPPVARLLVSAAGWSPWIPIELPVALLVLGVVVWLYSIVLPFEGRLLQKREKAVLAAVTDPLE